MTPSQDSLHLERAIELAEEALAAGNEPFGSLLVSAEGAILFEARNEVGGGDPTRHPEFAIARWAAEHLSPNERRRSTVFTSGEHCPMCAAAHGWVGLGRIVYAASAAQLAEWHKGLGVSPGPVRNLAIRDVVPPIEVEGPVPAVEARVFALHRRLHEERAAHGRVSE